MSTSRSAGGVFNDAEAIFSNFFGFSRPKVPPVQRNLTFTLEELHSGSKRNIKISITFPDAHGKPTTVEEILVIDIKPGWKKGTKITYPEKGNQDRGTIAGDLIFVIDEKPQAVYTRDGNDLLVKQKISLLDALTGKTLFLTTLDGREFVIPITNVAKPGDEMVIANEGMPISKEFGKKGDLRIKFDVKFPSSLTEDQKSVLRRGLGHS